MYNFEYKIKLNEFGRPYVDIPLEYNNKPEDKFMALEITAYILFSILEKHKFNYDSNSIEAINISFDTIKKISDEVALLLKNEMESMGDIQVLTNRKYDIEVDDIKQRNKLDDIIMYNGKIFKKEDGLKILVKKNMKIYEFNDNNWIEINK